MIMFFQLMYTIIEIFDILSYTNYKHTTDGIYFSHRYMSAEAEFSLWANIQKGHQNAKIPLAIKFD